MTGSGRYAFGEGHLASLRLAKVAEVFDPTSRAFLAAAAGDRLDLALDLGCGPGYTTRLISETLRPRRVVGLDRSNSFLALARQTATDGISFIEHDVTAVPFPTGAADLIYCRFLLTHLVEPVSQLAKWAAQLQPGGLLLIDEVETIQTENPVFGRYLRVVSAMLDYQSNKLHVGSSLHATPDIAGLRRRFSRTVTLVPDIRQVAEMFQMNLRVWRNGHFIKSSYPEEFVDELESDLASLATSGDRAGITWELRRIVYQSV